MYQRCIAKSEAMTHVVVRHPSYIHMTISAFIACANGMRLAANSPPGASAVTF
ncbi:hypothetical protein BCR44DRAFT_1429516 [Catenaria anguillulae PL171]|uniref:Uncharacterized protein n=1 Tax=Catenaria anguillulae PL171 TaxID=765915 RepID=A0A1Y2HTY3_9FUNG|nr:hypothetical protein BCR44DRAFT_1429516 [Catenaria anguillulae PL171]